MVSMLQALTERNDPTPVWFVHAARDGEHRPLRRESWYPSKTQELYDR